MQESIDTLFGDEEVKRLRVENTQLKYELAELLQALDEASPRSVTQQSLPCVM
jgi:hypothetical protein